MPFIRTLLELLRPLRGWLGLFLFCLLIEAAYATAAPLSLKYLVDRAFVPKDLHAFLLIVALLAGGGLVNIATSLGGDYSLGRISGQVVQNLRIRLFAHLQRQSLPFYQRYRVGDLVSRFSSDMSSVERVLQASFPYFVRSALSILLGVCLLFSIEWKLTLAMLVGSALMFIGPRLLQRRAETAHLRYKEAQERFANAIDETVKGHRTIANLHLQARFQTRARRQTQELFAFGLNVHLVGSLIERLPLLVLLVINGIMIGFGGYLIFHDEMTVGGFMAFFTLFLTVGQSASSLSYLIPGLIDSGTSFRRIQAVLDEQPDVPEHEHPQTLPAAIPSVRMENVVFGYSEETTQLRDVSLDIAAGSYVAFVGASGSGKSTALQLLARFYDPRLGAVSIGGLDLRTVSEASLREISTLVTQDTFLFRATIRDNLVLDSGASEADMREAAKLANIHDVIATWPDGYDTQVHHEGGSLSGGERQRLAIARALLRQPKLLLLDEVTAALDPATEADINRLIERLRTEKTIVSVTHRLASVQHADRIYVFRDGRIAEAGTHRQLLAEGGLYRSLWDKQFGFSLSPDGLYATVELERLAKFPFFAGLSPQVLQEIAALFATETSKAGETVVAEGEEGHKFYIIVRGRFEVLKRMPDGNERRVAVLQDGDHFGEIALLRNMPRTATVRALGPSVLLSLRQEAFHRLVSEQPLVRQALEATLLERIR